jgi:predicted metal-dependent phosphoesterase TrpH
MTAGPRLDLHVHSRFSPDSRLSLEEIAGQLVRVGLHGFALTDHNSIAGHAALADLRSSYPSSFFLPGAEISTREGHLLAYGIRSPPAAQRPLLETIEWVRAEGGEPVLSHPFRFSHGVGRRIAESAPVSALEVRNAHNSRRANAKAEALATRRGLAGTGGSDVHGLADLGQAYTQFPEGVSTVDDFLEAIRKGRVGAAGHTLSWPNRLRLRIGTGVRFLGRGLRPI